MDNETKFDTSELDLDAILNEFHDDTEEPAGAALAEETADESLQLARIIVPGM